MDMDMPMDADPSVGVQTAIDYATDFWYIVAGTVGFLGLVRLANALLGRQRLRACRDPAIADPTRPARLAAQVWATATAVGREMANPQARLSIRGLGWLSPPPAGRVMVLLAYWAVILYMMFSAGAVQHDVFFWERIGYRNAWTSLMQLPLVFLLASKANPIGLVIGAGHERLNWLHRWVARTLFVTATVHGFHFWTEWVLADFVQLELQSMPVIKYGLAAWGILLWTAVSSLRPVRAWRYEVFVVQHVLSFALLLWTIYLHVPTSGQWLVWFAIGAAALDRVVRWADLLWHNVHLRAARPSGGGGSGNGRAGDCGGCQCGGRAGRPWLGHRAFATAVGDATLLTVKDVHFSWRAGQHLYLWLPRIGPLEAHPYTISCSHRFEGRCACGSIQLMIRAHAGFSRRLHETVARRSQDGGEAARAGVDFTAFVSGPYGVPPRADVYENLVLVSASTGASFTLAILESVAPRKSPRCTRRVEFVLLTRRGEEIDLYLDRIRKVAAKFKGDDIALRVHIAVTRGGGAGSISRADTDSSGNTTTTASTQQQRRRSGDADAEKATATTTSLAPSKAEEDSRRRVLTSGDLDGVVIEYDGRPDLEALVREPVEAARGETAVMVCGGAGLSARMRNLVTRLSDERAVHKGTGAQGIYLYVEEYGF